LGLTHLYKTGLRSEECLLFINSHQESYLSDVRLEFSPIIISMTLFNLPPYMGNELTSRTYEMDTNILKALNYVQNSSL